MTIAHQNASGEFKPLKKDDNRHSTSYEGSVKALKRDKGTISTPKRDNNINALYAEDDIHGYGDGNSTLNRENGGRPASAGEHKSLDRNKKNIFL